LGADRRQKLPPKSSEELVLQGLEPLIDSFEPEAHPLLEGVEIAFRGDVRPADGGQHLHQRFRRLGPQRLLEAQEEFVSCSFIQHHDPPPRVIRQPGESVRGPLTKPPPLYRPPETLVAGPTPSGCPMSPP